MVFSICFANKWQEFILWLKSISVVQVWAFIMPLSERQIFIKFWDLLFLLKISNRPVSALIQLDSNISIL